MKTKRKFLRYVLNTAIFIGLIWAIVKYVDARAVRIALQNFNTVELPIILLLTLLFFVIRAGRFIILSNPFTDHLQNWVIFKGYVSGQAAALLPGGIAARAGLLNQVGVPPAYSSVPVAFHSGWDQAVFLLGGLIAAFWFPVARLPIFFVLSVNSFL